MKQACHLNATYFKKKPDEERKLCYFNKKKLLLEQRVIQAN
jgi:hypothetical protein